MTHGQIASVRRFHRMVTQRAGALEDSFLGRDRPLGESRVLFEIGTEGATLRELRGRLGLDSGYLSRITRSLSDRGLIEVEAEVADERVRYARLTAAGAAEVAEMDRRADAVAAGLLEPLSERQRSRLVAAMDDVFRLARFAGVRIHQVDPSSEEARACMASYFAELARRFPGGFEPSASLPADDADITPPRGVFLVAVVDGRPVASGAVKYLSDEVASIKRMWVDDDLRGLGLGRRMLAALEESARSLGFTVIRLETNGALTEAIRLYRESGYVDVPAFNDDPYAQHWFEKQV